MSWNIRGTGRQLGWPERSKPTQVRVGLDSEGRISDACLHHHQEGGPDFTFHLKTRFLCTLDSVLDKSQGGHLRKQTNKPNKPSEQLSKEETQETSWLGTALSCSQLKT